MQRIRSFLGLAIVLAMTGCGGGGGGGASVPSIYTSTMYIGQVNDQRFGKFQVDVNIDELTEFPGRVQPELFFFRINSSGGLTGQRQFNVFEPTGKRSEGYLTLQENSFNADMGTWPDYVPVSDAGAVICHLAVNGKISPDLKPGSSVTISYSSKDCDFVSEGSFVAKYDDVLVHDAN